MNGLELMDEAITRYKPVAVLGLFSGGHDSLTATHLASRHPAFTAAVHINTGIGVVETREFVRETCKSYGWRLKEYRAEDCGQVYREMILDHGFPGPGQHNKMYNRLKERPLRVCIKEHKTKLRQKVLLISGCRSEESTRRMGHVEPIQVEGAKVWCAVIHDWSKDDCHAYMAEHSLKRNPVVDLIHKSGECLCGAFAKKGELEELRCWYPKAAKEIEDLQAEVIEKGFPWDWEGKPPLWWLEKKKGQAMMFDLNPMMCQSCEKREEGGK